MEDIKLNVKKGTYEDMQEHYNEIGDKDFLLVEDKDVPVPETADAGKVISVNSDGEYELTTPTGGGGVPSGGTEGQVISKVDSTDQNVEWKTLTASDIPVDNSQSVQDNLERIDLEVEGLVDDVADLNSGKLNASKNAVANVGGLVTPTAVLSSNELVGIGTNGEQIRVQLGDGLTLEGSTSPYTLKASGGGGGGSITGYSLNITTYGPAGLNMKVLLFDNNVLKVVDVTSATTLANVIGFFNLSAHPDTAISGSQMFNISTGQLQTPTKTTDFYLLIQNSTLSAEN